VISGENKRVLVIGAAERDELVRLRQEALQEMAAGPEPLRQMELG